MGFKIALEKAKPILLEPVMSVDVTSPDDCMGDVIGDLNSRRGRVLGILLCIGNPLAPLDDIAKQGAAALELVNDYTDVIETARRRKPTTAAAEIQQNLFPPRITRIAGAQLAGGLLPTYEVGGDWFDFVENRDGAFSIPRQAIFEKQGKKLVYRKHGDKFDAVVIEIGSSSAGRVVVTKGLSKGDEIALRDPNEEKDV